MVARAWLNTDSGTVPLATAWTSVQPAGGQPAPGIPPTCRAPGVAHDSAVPEASAQVSPVASVLCDALRVLLALKKPAAVGCSWSSPCPIAAVLCVAGQSEPTIASE